VYILTIHSFAMSTNVDQCFFIIVVVWLCEFTSDCVQCSIHVTLVVKLAEYYFLTDDCLPKRRSSNHSYLLHLGPLLS